MSGASALPALPIELTMLVLLAVFAIEAARLIAGFRRAIRLNRALHELRRPLQSITLSIEGEHPDLDCAGACLEQARGALEELDAVVNRRPFARPPVRTALAQIAEALEDRWRIAGVRVSAPVGGRALEGDPIAIGAALDNLVANAVEHGGGEVSVRMLAAPTSVRFEVRDEGSEPAPANGAAGSRRSPRPEGDRASRSDPRRGHGLALAAARAAEHGGSLIAPARLPSGGTVAALSLPAPPEQTSR